LGTNDFTYINPERVSELVLNDDKFIREFAEATEKSFSEFKSNYGHYLLKRDEEEFRKAGHKIKPVALMLNLEVVVDEYEHAKTLLWEEEERDKLARSAEKIDEICTKIIEELRTIRDDH